MTSYVVSSSTTTLWHNKFIGDRVFLRDIEADIDGLQTDIMPPFPIALKLNGSLPSAERLIDIKQGDYIEIHWKMCGNPAEYSKVDIYMSIRVSMIEPMLISSIVSYYPPGEHVNASIRILGSCEIHRKLKDND